MKDAAYFHEDAGKAELRIVLDERMRANLRTLREAFPGQDERHAAYFAAEAVHALRSVDEAGGDHAAWYCAETSNTREEVLEKMTRLHQLGWISCATLADLLADAGPNDD